MIVSGKAEGMQFMDDAIWTFLQQGVVSPHEAFMKAIDKNRFKKFLPPEEEHLGDALYRSGRRYEARFAWKASLVTAEDEIAARVSAKLASGLTPANAAP